MSANIPWANIKAIGFDMDGTLYDEFEFINQVYHEIANLFVSGQEKIEKNIIFQFMIKRWLEKGSSYPHIFKEALTLLDYDEDQLSQKLESALFLFRNFKPSILLSPRFEFLLSELKSQKYLFLVSDGSSTLQWNKIEALKLLNFFEKENIFISGDHPIGFGKPSLKCLNFLKIFRGNIEYREVVFIGDRKVDQDFANNAGFYFTNQDSIRDLFKFNHQYLNLL